MNDHSQPNQCGQCGSILVRGPTGAYCQYCGLGEDGLQGHAQIARPASDASIAWKFTGGFVPVRAALSCMRDESALFVAGGRLLGHLSTGRHVLHPSSAPFLAAVVAGPAFNAELFLVRTDDCRVAVEGRVGTVIDAGASVTAAISINATAWVRATDPARLAAALTSGPLEPQVVESVSRAFLGAVTRYASAGESLLSVVSPARVAALAAEACHAASAELALLGLALSAIHPAALSLDDTSMGAIAEAHRRGPQHATTAASRSATTSAGALTAGAAVRAQWTDGGWYGAKVRAVHGGMVEVVWDDGTGAMWVRPEQVRAPNAAAAASPRDVGASVSISNGAHVQAQWINEKWYGAVVRAQANGMYEVVWDDGSSPRWVRADQLVLDGGGAPVKAASKEKGIVGKVLETMAEGYHAGGFKVGQRVQAKWRDGKYYRGTIVDRATGSYEIAWDDGSASLWVSSAFVRSE